MIKNPLPKLNLIKKKMESIMKIFLERNMLIFLLSILLFYLLFLSPTGIIKSYYDFNLRNYNLKKEINNYELKTKLLHDKLNYLRTNNKDLIEEIIYVYFNKDPYGNEKKIIEINSEIKDKKS